MRSWVVLLACACLVSACGRETKRGEPLDDAPAREGSASHSSVSADVPEGSVLAFDEVDDAVEYADKLFEAEPPEHVVIEREGGSYIPGGGVRSYVVVESADGEKELRKSIEQRAAKLLPEGRRLAWGIVFAFDPDTGARKLRGRRTYVLSRRLLSERDVAKVAAEDGDRAAGTSSGVRIELTPTGAKKFTDATTELQSRRFAIVVEGLVDSAPIVMGPISGGTAIITMGEDPDNKARDALIAKLERAIR